MQAAAAPYAVYATSTLRNAQNRSGWRSRNERCKAPEVLGEGGENKLVLSNSRATQSKPEPKDALQVREPHLNLLTLTTPDCSKHSVLKNDLAISRAS